MAGEIVHIEFRSDDHQRSALFYGKLFGWTTEVFPEANYMTFAAPGGPGGGFVKPGDTQSPGCLAYIGVDDIDRKLGEIEAAGGRTVFGKHPIGPMGFAAVFIDPDGNTVGLWQAGKAAPARGAAAGKPPSRAVAKGPAGRAGPPAKKRR